MTDPVLDLYQTRLDDLNQDYKSVQKQLRNEQDGPTQNKLERQIQDIVKEMDELPQKIRQRQEELRQKETNIALTALRTLLESFPAQLAIIVRAYQRTIAHWPVDVNQEAETVDAILTELARITPNPKYTAQDEFIAHLVHDTSAPELSTGLQRWGTQYRPEQDWLQLYGQIQQEYDQRLENAQPAILIAIARSDEASTQSTTDETYYQLNAWLVEDIELYQTQKTGYHALVAPESTDAEPCQIDELLEKITDLIQQFLAEKNRICNACLNPPQIHVFLPLELMDLPVDFWRTNALSERRPAYLGHDHIVVVRCARRYERTYTKRSRWLNLWKRHQQLLGHSAQQVFVPGHDEDLDELMEILDDAVQVKDSHVVGLHVTRTPLDTEELCYELLDSGLPLALWPRQDLADTAHEVQLLALLNTCCLEQLPHTVKTKRYETRRKKNAPDCHIGHHLSLLWDDPDLVPPKTA